MSTWGVIQGLIDVGLGAGLFFLGMRILRQPKDDPRLSRGLQLLQAKISVLEDLSDRSEAQTTQMVALLEQKARELQAKIQLADKHVQLIQESMGKSLEVAQIFEDKIPHQEIIERQNTKKYLKAARLAHQGRSPQEIAQEVDLPMGEIEFIAKVNRDQLMFSEDQLPEWAREQAANHQAIAQAEQRVEASGVQQSVEETKRLSQLANQQELVENLQQVQQELEEMLRKESVMRDYSGAFNVPKPSTDSLNKLGEEFRKARAEVETPAFQFNSQTSELSFVELTPPPEEQAPSMQQAVQAAAMKTALAAPREMQAHIEHPNNEFALTDFDEPLLDLSTDQIEQLKASAPTPVPQPTYVPQPAPIAAAAAPAKSSADPVLAAKAAALEQARAVAQELRRPQLKASVNAQAPLGATARPQAPRPAPAAREAASQGPTTIKRVEFPRIDGGKSPR